MFKKVQKRTGEIVAFNQNKITEAIFKALAATNKGDRKKAEELSEKVVALLSKRIKKDQTPHVEQIQDIAEEVLILEGLAKTAKAYILYREQRRRIREVKKAEEEALEMIDRYLEEMDWEVNENANLAYSLQGLHKYIVSSVSKKYWLNRLYPPEIRQAEIDGDLHIHKLQSLSPYCAGWDLYDLLLKGFGGVAGKIQSKPAKHFGAALGQIVNFIYMSSTEVPEGAVAFSNFDTLLSPFVRYDRLSYQEVKQALQEFLFNANLPTKIGFQSSFSNLTFDVTPSPVFAETPVLIGGKPQKEKYKEFQKEMDMINQGFYETMLEGDANQRVFTFPIPTINITKDFPWDKKALEPMWKATAKYGPNYFANYYINSDMKPEDCYSMCCRMQIDKTQLYNRGGGGLFGSGVNTGSIGVTTIDMARIGYLSKTHSTSSGQAKKEFFERLERLMDLAKAGLEIKRKTIEGFTEKGLYPFSRFWLLGIKKMRGQYWANHFSTIGLIGMNEACLNFMGKPRTKVRDMDIGSKEGRKFALQVLDFMRKKLVEYQKQTGNLYNLEATPAEGTSYRLALKDKEKYPDIITAGTKKVPYYTNSTNLPVNYTNDIFEALELQDEILQKYTGGSVFHVFLGEKLQDGSQAKKLVKKIFENFKLPYISLTPTFSICPVHGYLSGEHFNCPKCTIKQPCEVYSRICGYLRPLVQWNVGKQIEYSQRKTFKIRKNK